MWQYVFCVNVKHWLLCQTAEIDEMFHHASVKYTGARVKYSATTDICWLISIFQYQFGVAGAFEVD